MGGPVDRPPWAFRTRTAAGGIPPARRAFAAFAVVLLAVSGLVVFSAGPARGLLSKTWTSDADFAGGTYWDTRLVGAGSSASIELATNPVYDWIAMHPAAAPSPRRGAVMAYDEEDNVVLLFGGRVAHGKYVNDLWSYSVPTNTWTNLTPANGPSPRWKAGFSYDPGLKAVILVGGWNATGGSDDVWRYYVTNRTWLEVEPSGRFPRAMLSTPTVYDRALGLHILAGTDYAVNPPYGILETWSYEAAENVWTLLDPDPLPIIWPTATIGHTLTYDRVSQKVVLFGGSANVVYGDVWEWDASAGTWVDAAPWTQDRTPNKRTEHSMVFGPNGILSILFGGMDNFGVYQVGTWVYSSVSKQWFQPASAFFPPPRRDAAMAWDAEDDRVVMFGGFLNNATEGNDTWVWGPGYFDRGTYESTTFDAGCNAPVWKAVWWNSTLPPKTTVRVQLATSPSEAGPFSFRGWDGRTGTYYNGTPGQAIWSGHNAPPTQRYLRWRGTLTTAEGLVTPALNDVTVEFACFPQLPYITSTVPADHAWDVPRTADIVVAFSEAMNATSVSWTFSDPAVTFTPYWSADHRVLTLHHATPFTECAFLTTTIRGKDEDHGFDLVPGPAANPWTFSTSCSLPKILRTSPADRDLSVPLDANVVVTFNEPMDNATVRWTITGGVVLTSAWDDAGSVLTLSHTTPFEACTPYTAEITAATDRGGLPLVPGPVPNPWTFTTACPNPYIVSTDPADGRMWVPVGAPIVVRFSKPIDDASVAWTIAPPIPLTKSWSEGGAVLTLGHASPFVGFTRYEVNITSARDGGGLPLVPGPVPNPWSFWTTTVTTLGAPANLRVSMAGADVSLTWDTVPGATRYNVYEAGDRFALWPWGLLGTTPAPPFRAAGHGADLLTHFYVVRASDGAQEGRNSTMGVKAALPFAPSLAYTNIAWFSLPYVSEYRKASDIVRALGYPDIDVVGKWVPAMQSSIVYYYERGAWRGTDFPVAAGDGLYLGVRRAFVWNVTGTDANVTLSFTWNPPPRGNVNWIGLPYTGVYARASDIADELGPSRISEVGLWNPATQTSVWWYWTGTSWTGSDFSIPPGAGVYVIVVTGFRWNPRLVTPPVP